MDNIKLERAVAELNPWWAGEPIGYEIKPRELSLEINRYMRGRQMIAITGLRRTGKTMLLHKTIELLLKGNDAREILYFSFDDFSDADPYELPSIAKAVSGKEPKYIFLDEVQKVPGWQDKVKRLYDARKGKIFISGSESLFIKGKAKESLAGRIYEFQLKPLSFSEYADFSGVGKNPRLDGRKLRELFAEYLATGGFPELVGEKDGVHIRKYIRESILEKVLFSDLPKLFRIEEPSILQSLLNIIIDNPGMLVEISSLSKDLGVTRQTLSKYLYALEVSLLVKKLYNYSKSRTSTERKLKRYYPSFASSAIRAGADELHLSRLVETSCVLHSGASFFWRTPQKDEVDIVLETQGGALPVEVKWGKTENSSGLRKFVKKFGGRRGILLTNETRKRTGEIECLPVIEYLLAPSSVYYASKK